MVTEGYKLKIHSKFAVYYDTFYSKMYKKSVEVIHWIIQKYSKHSPDNILDLMCGTGAHILGLRKKGYRKIVGVDNSKEMVKLAQNKLKNIKDVRVILLNVRNLNFFKEFEVIYCWFNSLQYLFTDDNLEKVLRNVNNALRPNGLFIVDLRNRIPFLLELKEKLPISLKAKYGNIEIINTTQNLLYDEGTHIATFNVEYTIKDKDKIYKEKERHSYRLFTPSEFQMFSEKSDFIVKKIFGSSTQINISFDEQKSNEMVFIETK
jgi:SAM-dependent methyltransferase